MEIHELTAEQAERLRAWTFPAYRHLMDLRPAQRRPGGDRRMVQPVAFAALEDGHPRGLAVGCVPVASVAEMRNDPELLSLYVAPGARGKGVAGALVEAVEDAVSARGGGEIGAVYMTGPPEIAHFERVLARRGWTAPEARMLVVKATVEQTFGMPWNGRVDRTERFEYFPWSEMTEDDLRRLEEADRQNPWIADDLKPWHYDRATMDPASSIGIRFDGQVVGWVLNHPLSSETLRFTCSFIRRDLGRRARIIPAYSESLRRAHAAGFKRITFAVPMHHPGMTGFVQRWWTPYGVEQVETRGSTKELASSRAAAA